MNIATNEYKYLLDQCLDYGGLYLKSQNKKLIFDPLIKYLNNWHYNNCPNYFNLIESDGSQNNGVGHHGVPVRLFKQYDLLSVSSNDVVKTLLSSGTTGQSQSKIYLDSITARYQTIVLSKIMTEVIGSKRLPMLIVDSEQQLKSSSMFSARAAGIRGFSTYGKDIHFALDDDLEFNHEVVANFFTKYRDKKKFVFGFTFLIWKSFLPFLNAMKDVLQFEGAQILHGGGWKKLENEKISKKCFRTLFIDLGFDSVQDYYGMVEQTGSIFIECEKGFFHANKFNDVSIIDPFDFSELPAGQQGLLSLESVIPFSYPGHRILTEDTGVIFGVDDCDCGRYGKYFSIAGRLPEAEVRGCSNVM